MINLFKKINDSFDGIIWNLATFGVIFLILGLLIVMDGSLFVLRLVTGAIILVIAYILLYGAFKFFIIKKHINDHVDIKENFKDIIKNKKI